MIAEYLSRLFDRHYVDPSHPPCPQCKSLAETAMHWRRDEARLVDEVWMVQTTPSRIAHCPVCHHEWTVHVERPVQELSLRAEGPYVAAGSLEYLTPVHLHLLEIAFDLGQHDAPQPNAWTAVQSYIELSDVFGAMGSPLDDLREMAAAVQAGIETGVYGHDELSMEPKEGAVDTALPAEYVVTWRYEAGYVCDREWLLDRLNTLLATYEQSHDADYARRYEPLFAAGRRAIEAQRTPAQPKPVSWCQVVIAGLVFVVTLAGIGWFVAALTEKSLYVDFYLIMAALVGIAVCWVLVLEVVPRWLSKLICPRR